MKLAPPLFTAWLRVQAYAAPAMVLIALTLPGIGQGWFRTDAPRYAALSQTVYGDGPWWSPWMGELPYFNKPPLAFWAHGAVYQATGPTVWATRATTLVVALIALLVTVDLVRRLSSRRAALLAGLVLATTLEFFRYTRTFSLDLWLVMLFAIAAWLAVMGTRRERWTWVVAAGVPLGLSLLVKPMLAAMPVAMLGVWVVWVGKAQRLAPLLVAGAVAAMIAAPWHVAMSSVHGEAFTSTYFGSQTLDRVEGTMAEDHAWWFYFLELPKGAGPWVVTGLLAVAAGAMGRFRGREGDRWLFRLAVLGAVLWFVVPTLFGDRRPRYIVPIYPFVAMLSGLWLARVATPALRGRGPARRLMPFVAPAVLAGSIAVAMSPLRVHEPINPKWQAILEYHLEHGAGEPLWTSKGSNTQAANLYLLTGQWPVLAGPDGDGRGSAPPAGALVIVARQDVERWVDRGEVVLEARNLRLVRVE